MAGVGERDPTLTDDHPGVEHTADPGGAERYTIDRELARGGAGRVLIAHDHRLDRTVALKTPIRGETAARLEREARIVARLAHPAIIPIHDVGRFSDGTPFFAMKLVEGRSLRDEVRSRPD